MQNKSEVLCEFLKKLRSSFEKEDMNQFNEHLIEFNEWLKSLNEEEKVEIMPIGMREIDLIMNEVEDKKQMYEEIAFDQTKKHSANQKYSQY